MCWELFGLNKAKGIYNKSLAELDRINVAVQLGRQSCCVIRHLYRLGESSSNSRMFLKLIYNDLYMMFILFLSI